MSAQELSQLPETSVDAPAEGSRDGRSEARPQRPAETHLRLRGLTGDGTRLLLVDGAGLEFTVDIDARLRAALHGDPSLSGSRTTPAPGATHPTRTSEKTMESMLLRPRDIQARIRSGETPEAVAEAAQTTVDKVMPYAAPVLAEREHVAERALRASIRRPAGEIRHSEPAGTNRLGEAISGRLRAMNVDPDTVIWDAWRREDGRWSLSASFSAGGHEGLARLTYDQPGNFVLLDNDEACWLVGDHLDAPADETEALPVEPSGRLLSAVPSEQLALSADDLGADAIELVSDTPVEAYLDIPAPETPRPPMPTAREPRDSDATEEIEVVAADPAADEPAAKAPARKKRASVPSWDEIMFGGPGQE